MPNIVYCSLVFRLLENYETGLIKELQIPAVTKDWDINYANVLIGLIN